MSIVQFVKGARLEWACYVWRADDSISKTVFVNNLNRKRAHGRPKQRWLNVVKIDTYVRVETKLSWGPEPCLYNRED